MFPFALQKIGKNFDSVRALEGIDLDFHPGEVIGLMGDNGAGKSTLVSILAGLLQPDHGQILVDGMPVGFATPHIAQDNGIAVVYQDLALCENLTAAENLFLGREPRRFGLIDHKVLRADAARLFAELGATTPPDALVKNLSGGQRQATAIARVLIGAARLVLLDEPTAAISLRQVEEVLTLIRNLKARGTSVVLISHRMSDIFAVCDRIVVLWRGRIVADKPTSDISAEEVVGFITGAEMVAA